MRDIHPPKAMFFDWDGTLVDSVQFILNSHNFARAKLGLKSMDLDSFQPYFGMPRDKLYTELYGDQSDRAPDFFNAYVHDNHIRDLEIAPGAEELMTWLKDRNLPAGVVSNKRSEFIRAEIVHFGWQDVFDVVIGSGDCPKDKPAPDPLLTAIADSRADKIDKTEIWYIGDTKTDQACARDAGCPFIFIGHEGVPKTLTADYPPLVSFADCKQFHQKLLQIA